MQILLILTLALFISSNLWMPISDPDLWWHTTVGRWILSHKTVPHEDIWNAFSGNAPWRAYSWSMEVLLAFFELNLGIPGLMLFKMFISVFLFAALVFCFSKLSKDLIIGFCLTALSLAALTPYFGLRPQVISWALFAYIIYLAQQINQFSAKKTSTLIAIFLTSLLWANSHLTSVIGVICATLWVLQSKGNSLNFKTALLVLAICLLGTMITPYFGGEWLTLVSKSEHPFSHIYIGEFQPATLYHIAADILLLLTVLLFLFVHYKPKTLTAVQLVLAGTFCLVGFTIQKFIPYAVILTASLICIIWGENSENRRALSNIGESIHLLLDLIRKTPKFLSLTLSILLLVLVANRTNTSLANPLDLKRVPKEPIDFIFENDLPKPLLHGFNEGGYLMYRLSNNSGEPSQKVILDGRTNVNNQEIVEEFLSALHSRSDWKKIFNRIRPKTVLWENSFPLTTILLEKGNWCHVFPNASSPVNSSRWSVFVFRADWLPIKHKIRSRSCG